MARLVTLVLDRLRYHSSLTSASALQKLPIGRIELLDNYCLTLGLIDDVIEIMQVEIVYFRPVVQTASFTYSLRQATMIFCLNTSAFRLSKTRFKAAHISGFVDSIQLDLDVLPPSHAGDQRLRSRDTLQT